MNRSSFDEFLTVVTNRVWEYLPECFSDARFELSTVAKNNGFVLTGLVIRSNTSNTSPVIYLDQYYEAYMDGRDIDDILREIAQVRLETEVKDSFGAENIMDFDFVKDKIVPRLSSIEWNTGLLEVRPHTQIADLAVTYYVMLAQNETGVASIPVTFQLMENWGVDTETLHSYAVRNLTDLFPSSFMSMSSMLRGLLPSISDDDSSDLFTQDDMMFILTSEQKLNGAANILDKAMMDRVLDRFGEDFYLLPSSIHEWILVSDKGLNPSFLTSMVQEVNAGEVPLEERLSSHVYRYTASEGLICA